MGEDACTHRAMLHTPRTVNPLQATSSQQSRSTSQSISSSLECLYLSHCSGLGPGLGAIADALPLLRVLKVDHAEIVDQDVAHIMTCCGMTHDAWVVSIVGYV